MKIKINCPACGHDHIETIAEFFIHGESTNARCAHCHYAITKSDITKQGCEEILHYLKAIGLVKE
ncbi:ECs_2282 family putative zinc-binding protein [Serratia nevei]|uniref:ECs_2282 family putative zinc-binding protein n=1 Tax=Serratia nevei TaxID=2703794 RepID=UPI0039B7694D